VPNVVKTSKMARRILQAAALVALAAFGGAVDAAKCATSGMSASVTPISGTRCMVLYGSGWKYLYMHTDMDGSVNTVNVNSLKAAALYAEFYRDAECSPNAYMGALDCAAGSVPTTPTNKPTSSPTNKPTSSPTNKPTSSPTNKPTSTPTTKPTNPPTNPPTNAPTTRPPPTSAPVGGTAVPPTNGYNGGPPVGQMRAMYLWGLGSCLFNQVSSSQYASRCSGQSSYTAYQDWLLNQLRNPAGRYAPYNHMYLDISPNLLTSQTAMVRAFLKKAAAVGITTELLTGDANWVTSSSAAQTPINICKQVATFNRGAASAAERFYGIHLDIEPYLTAGWESNNGAGRDPWNDAYENTLINILRTCKNEGASSNMIVSWAIPTWFSALAHDLFDPLLQSPFVDYVVVMNYYSNQNLWINGPGGNVGGIVNNLNRLQGKVPAVFAAETQDTSVVPSSESFWAGGRLKMENMFGVAGFQFKSHAGFKGTATHFLNSYLNMPA